LKENVMHIREIRAIGERSTLAELLEIKRKLSKSILSGALDGTNAPQALKIVDRTIAKRELEDIFK